MSEDRRGTGQEDVARPPSDAAAWSALAQAGHITAAGIPGGWKEERLNVGRHAFDLVLPSDPDAFLEHLELEAARGLPIPDPYWARLWPCSLQLAEAILRTTWQPNEAALEIGCGAGLPGLAALSEGLEVTFSDYEPMAIALALENARRNGYRRAEGLLLDWRHPHPRRYPFIFGSDLVYDVKLHEPLLGVVRDMLSDHGACWLGDPGRYHTASFVQRARAANFDVALFDEQDRPIPEPRTGNFQRIVLKTRTRGR